MNTDDAFFNELVTTGIDYWTTVSKFMPDWQRVRNGLRPIELRQENISTHSVVLRALGGLGAEVVKQYPTDWKNRLADLTAVDWSKKNRERENVCMVANSVVSNRQARLATKAYLPWAIFFRACSPSICFPPSPRFSTRWIPTIDFLPGRSASKPRVKTPACQRVIVALTLPHECINLGSRADQR